MSDEAALTVSEVFGPTVQGEGPSLGRRCGFVRLGRCNLDCGKGPGATWSCDTAYTWDWDTYDPTVELTRLAVADVALAVARMHVDMVVVTGGEPLLQQRGIIALAERLDGVRLEIETNGTIAPATRLIELAAQFNVSPKLANSGVGLSRRRLPAVLQTFASIASAGKAVFKFVVSDLQDFDEITEVVGKLELDPSRVWIMPAGTDAPTLTSRQAELVDEVVRRGWNLTTRLHILLWGDRRGV